MDESSFYNELSLMFVHIDTESLITEWMWCLLYIHDVSLDGE